MRDVVNIKTGLSYRKRTMICKRRASKRLDMALLVEAKHIRDRIKRLDERLDSIEATISGITVIDKECMDGFRLILDDAKRKHQQS